MRRILWLAAASILVVPASTWGQQADQQPAPVPQDQSQSQTVAAPEQDSLAEAARKAREQKKDATKPAKTFDNDNIPTTGGISSVGEGTTAPSGGDTQSASAKPANDEKSWRDKFASLRHKLEQDQADLDVLQRELGVLNTQFYTDPNKALQQQLTRSDINDKIAEIDKKKAQIAADQQAISDAEDDLRKAGGDPGWAR